MFTENWKIVCLLFVRVWNNIHDISIRFGRVLVTWLNVIGVSLFGLLISLFAITRFHLFVNYWYFSLLVIFIGFEAVFVSGGYSLVSANYSVVPALAELLAAYLLFNTKLLPRSSFNPKSAYIILIVSVLLSSIPEILGFFGNFSEDSLAAISLSFVWVSLGTTVRDFGTITLWNTIVGSINFGDVEIYTVKIQSEPSIANFIETVHSMIPVLQDIEETASQNPQHYDVILRGLNENVLRPLYGSLPNVASPNGQKVLYKFKEYKDVELLDIQKQIDDYDEMDKRHLSLQEARKMNNILFQKLHRSIIKISQTSPGENIQIEALQIMFRIVELGLIFYHIVTVLRQPHIAYYIIFGFTAITLFSLFLACVLFYFRERKINRVMREEEVAGEVAGEVTVELEGEGEGEEEVAREGEEEVAREGEEEVAREGEEEVAEDKDAAEVENESST